MPTFLIYGAYGYTGQLCAEHAVTRGLKPILAGRDARKLEPLARQLALEYRAFSLSPRDAISGALDGVAAVLHVAGPFSATSRPMADACIQRRIHYVDVTGEISVFEALATRDEEARRAGVTLLPGAGFDVVPSDCLAAHVKRRLPTATSLRLAIGGVRGVSRGTAKTMVEGAAHGTRVRRGGELLELDDPPRTTVDFGNGPQPAIGLSWGDVASAWRSTRIPNIEVYFEASPQLKRSSAMPPLMKAVVRTRFGQWLAKNRIDRRMPPGPDRDVRSKARTIVVADAWDDAGSHALSRLETMEPYSLTALTAVDITDRVASGAVSPGYQTPATAFGPDFILGYPATTRVDLSVSA